MIVMKSSLKMSFLRQVSSFYFPNINTASRRFPVRLLNLSFNSSGSIQTTGAVVSEESCCGKLPSTLWRAKSFYNSQVPFGFLQSSRMKSEFGSTRPMVRCFSSDAKDMKNSTEIPEVKSNSKHEHLSNETLKRPVTTTSPPMSSPRKTTPSSVAALAKRAKRKTSTRTVIDEYGYSYDKDETFPIIAYAVCEEFNLKSMRKGLISQGLYIPTVLSEDLSDVIHVSAKYPIGDEPREIFFFRESAVIFWNVPYLERVNVLKFLKDYEEESYAETEIEEECEFMSYMHSDQSVTRLLRGRVHLGSESPNKLLEKYAFANALASSVKLGIWEATLEKYVEGTEALKRAEEIKLSRAEVLQKIGELFALRHQLNLNSDLLDTPDFYWERERLETLYQKTCDYLSINRRTKVMNEKLTQCCELLELISSHLTDNHHTRLEWMIIVLIMIEVGFEILHLLERYELIQ